MINDDHASLTRRLLLKLGAGAMAAPAAAAVNHHLSGPSGYNSNVPTKQVNDITLWYDRPASAWTEALPVGNGRLGAMHFGGVDSEHLQLNEGTLWAGGPHDYDHQGAFEYLAEIRKLIFDGKYREATALADKNVMSQPIGQAPYQTIGDLHLEFGHAETSGYRRTLDIDRAVSEVSYHSDGKLFTRQLIASYPDQLIALHLTCSKPQSISFQAKFTSPQHGTAMASDQTLRFEGVGPDFDGVPGVVRFVALARIHAKGGTTQAAGDSISVTGADEVTVLVSLATSYRSYEDVSGDPSTLAESHLANAQRKSFADLLKRHIHDYQQLVHRVSIDLGGTASDQPTDRRILDFSSGADTALPALYFQYGRYLLIAGSRPGGQAATLQGLWNDSKTPPWGSKYTININTEMNYWPAEKAALSECHEPLFELISEIAKTGRKTAQVNYGAKGWVTHHNTDGWRGAAPIDGASWGLWPMGGAWLCTHLWEHYLFSRDRSKLRHHYELIKGSVEFFLSTLVEYPGKGWLVTNPSTSPENQHSHGSGLCAGATMDMQIIRDLFEIFVQASNILGLDPEMRKQVSDALSRLAPMQIGHAGQLQEWLEDWDLQAPELTHRHVSHLYGLFPSHQITPEHTPDLADAARKTLAIRGDAGTGWSLAWKINFWARLHDGNHAYRLIKDALHPEGHGGGGVYPNLFDAHPPFQIDGNFGFTSGVIEMLLQSHDGIHLLPALPSVWPAGEVKGLRARGGVGVDIAWSDGALSKVVLRPDHRMKASVRYQGSSVDLDLEPGTTVSLDGMLGIVS